ncbi:arrestin domain-containing protein 3-like isoform X2 [Acyrthosiphon pisum]|uniref:Arrestin C-terminal-like domain-containing protein n=1 Tax=Acyrthosiphon pisum TaxID=7029 RepID=A0A8R2NRA8_ACYPI|nr:arrestin domain-containing protein 3-like isoform X2 [Acyrthosiphon pisum]|eukprot:XP_008180869.1 PREDICTED: arrestin domain-containing protein 3-like isoform X2 [Acyrthosiphon pisum]
MDYIREFDIRLDKEMFYAGEILEGHVVLDTIENFKLKTVRIVLRGKAHAEWQVLVSGDRSAIKDDQYFIDNRSLIFGKDRQEGPAPILPRGIHHFPFKFQLPQSSLPCSFESKPGYVRYYIKVTLDIPYASPPQGMKYFTIIGPHIDCMDDQYLKPIGALEKRTKCCLCCKSNRVVLQCLLERSAYVCGEALRLKANIKNQNEKDIRLKVRLLQNVHYSVERGMLGVQNQKDVQHSVLEYIGEPIRTGCESQWDSADGLVLPVMPPTLIGNCRLLQIYYVLKVCVDLGKGDEDLNITFPITIATVPFRIPNCNKTPQIYYSVACDHVEGGRYIGPEFLLGGHVYDGSQTEQIVLYRPVYVSVRQPNCNSTSAAATAVSTATSTATTTTTTTTT